MGMIGESPGEREGIMSEDFLNSLRQTITETAGAVGKKTEDLVEIQKLRGKLRSVSRAIDLDLSLIHICMGAEVYRSIRRRIRTVFIMEMVYGSDGSRHSSLSDPVLCL